MDPSALRILRAVAKRYDVTLKEALAMSPKKHGDYRDQYPLALLFEGAYLGFTMNHTPPEGAEKMREYSQALMLHDMSIKKKQDGSVAPAAIFFDGSSEHVFLKAKGALYLEEYYGKKKERLFALFLGIASAYLAAWFTTWLK